MSDSISIQLRQVMDIIDFAIFAGGGCPVVIDGKLIPPKWQDEIRNNLRHLAEEVEKARALLPGIIEQVEGMEKDKATE